KGAQLAAGGDVPEFHGTVLATADQSRPIRTKCDGVDNVNVVELGVAEDAGDVVGKVGGEGGDLPAGLAKVVAGLKQVAGGQAGGEAVGAGEPFRREFFREPGGIGGGAFGLELGLQVADLLGRQRFCALGSAAGQPGEKDNQAGRSEKGQGQVAEAETRGLL